MSNLVHGWTTLSTNIRSGGEKEFSDLLREQGLPRVFFPKGLVRFDYDLNSGLVRCEFESAEGMLSPSGSLCFGQSIVFNPSGEKHGAEGLSVEFKSGLRLASEIFGLKVVGQVQSLRFRRDTVVLNHEFGSEVMSIRDFELTA